MGRTSRRHHCRRADNQLTCSADRAIALEQPGRFGPRLDAGKALDVSHAGVGDQLTAVGQCAIAGVDSQLAQAGIGGRRCRCAGECRATREHHTLRVDRRAACAGGLTPIQRRRAQFDLAEAGRPQLQAIGEINDVACTQREAIACGDAGQLAAAKPCDAAGAALTVRKAGDRAIAQHQGSARQFKCLDVEGKARVEGNATGGIGQHGPGLHRTAG